ncbi:MAG: RnfABCDGE type electron transport complex subunit G [Candidatus Cloacimonadota bacterium]|nr:RnfABCDGE type electron transport complex subunit G [Candidatus Cloacimonadota bacterium]
MKYYFKLGVILLLITAVASGVLAVVNNYTKPLIAQNKQKTEEEARRMVLPKAETFETDSIEIQEAKVKPDPLMIQKESDKSSYFKYYIGKDEAGEVTGYTFVARKYGYSSNIETMVGVKPDLKINKIKVINQAETPGLGANCENEDFTKNFIGRTIPKLLVDKDGGDIESLTGATITSRAIINSIKDGLQNLKQALSSSDNNEEDKE